jgi:alginate O-acetyltransferase complex protein AlgI
MNNFNHPYFATSIQEFWTRWHISLSTWFRDYLYIPLGGNRVSKMRWFFNIMVTFLLSGLWHGANWTFVIWGALHGTYIVFGWIIKSLWYTFSKRLELLENLSPFSCLFKLLQVITTFSLVSFAWVFFRAKTIADSLYIARHLLSGLKKMTVLFLVNDFNYSVKTAASLMSGQTVSDVVLSIFAVVILLCVELYQYHNNRLPQISSMPLFVRWILYILLLSFILLFGKIFTLEPQSFIYFQF